MVMDLLLKAGALVNAVNKGQVRFNIMAVIVSDFLPRVQMTFKTSILVHSPPRRCQQELPRMC